MKTVVFTETNSRRQVAAMYSSSVRPPKDLGPQVDLTVYWGNMYFKLQLQRTLPGLTVSCLSGSSKELTTIS